MELLLVELLNEEQKEELAQATKRAEDATGIIEYNKAQRVLRTTRAALGLQRDKDSLLEDWDKKPICRMRYTDEQKEAITKAKEEIEECKKAADRAKTKEAEEIGNNKERLSEPSTKGPPERNGESERR